VKQPILHIVGLLALVAGCDATTPGTGAAPQPEAFSHATPTEHGPAQLGPDGVVPADPEEGQRAHRMTVDQLRRSIPALFGGLTWTLPTRQGEVEGFTALARTLGEADYIEATHDNTDPSPLFAKFMDDMAADVCRAAVARDAAGGSPRLVVQHPDDVQANLRFLRLKLHGIYVPEGSQEGLQGLTALHDDILAETQDPDQAWWGVCIAMLTAPELLAY
jgi:hypothetical protein